MDKQVSWNRSAHDDFDFYSSISHRDLYAVYRFLKKKKINMNDEKRID